MRMVQQKKSSPADAMNGSNKRSQPTMSFARSTITDARVIGGNQNNRNGKYKHKGLHGHVSVADVLQGNRVGFQTDSSISGGRFGAERELKRWTPDIPEDADGSLEKASDNRPWDQFAANEEKFGLKTDYDENIYTTAIDRSAPSYKARMAKADQLARQIERSAPASSHVAEERTMDYVEGADGGLDEEDKYASRFSFFDPANSSTDTVVSSDKTSRPSAARTRTSTRRRPDVRLLRTRLSREHLSTPQSSRPN